MPALHDGDAWPPISPLINRKPDANRLLEDSMKLQDNQKRVSQLNALRQKQMAHDTARLLALACELKAEAEKGRGTGTRADALSKAEEIEKLARGVRERMTGVVVN
jgi:hypothetical protein